MATEPDPYRTLGLPRTASLTEVKAAYRRLAKANHPDTAGEAAVPAVPRDPGRLRASCRTDARPPDRRPRRHHRRRSASRGRPIPTGAMRPAGRTAGGRVDRPARPRRRPGAGRSRAVRPAAATSGTAGPTGTTGDAGASKDPKKATLGSTSYDEADREAFEPDWAGSSWYGTTSGTYWTINPKEYADPRKHGPEYQARARRASQAGKDADAGIAAGRPAAPPDRPAAGRRRSDPAGPDASVLGEPASASAAGLGQRPRPTQRLATRPRPGGTRRPAPRPASTTPATTRHRMGLRAHARPPSHVRRRDRRPLLPPPPRPMAGPAWTRSGAP